MAMHYTMLAQRARMGGCYWLCVSGPGSQITSRQAPFFEAQMPQLALQQKVPSSHVLPPQPPTGPSLTHMALASHGAGATTPSPLAHRDTTSQCVPGLHLTSLQGSTGGGSSTQMAACGQGAVTHTSSVSSQCLPGGQVLSSQVGTLMQRGVPVELSQ